MKPTIHIVIVKGKAVGAFHSEREALVFRTWYETQHPDTVADEVSSVTVSKSAKAAAMALCGIPSKG